MPSSACDWSSDVCSSDRSEEHTSELQSRSDLVCRLLLEKKKKHESATSDAGRNRQHDEQQLVRQRHTPGESRRAIQPARRPSHVTPTHALLRWLTGTHAH